MTSLIFTSHVSRLSNLGFLNTSRSDVFLLIGCVNCGNSKTHIYIWFLSKQSMPTSRSMSNEYRLGSREQLQQERLFCVLESWPLPDIR